MRVTCESTAKGGCNVFLDCKDQAGMNTFGEAGMMVGPGDDEWLGNRTDIAGSPWAWMTLLGKVGWLATFCQALRSLFRC